MQMLQRCSFFLLRCFFLILFNFRWQITADDTWNGNYTEPTPAPQIQVDQEEEIGESNDGSSSDAASIRGIHVLMMAIACLSITPLC